MLPRNGLLILVALLFLGGCEQSGEVAAPKLRYMTQSEPPAVTTYQFAIHPLHNPVGLSDAYQPLLDYFNQKMPEVHFELEASRDYQVYEEKIRSKKPAFLLPNPWQTLLAMREGYHVIAQAGDPQDFRGVLIGRKDSPIKTVADTKGKTISYPSHTALAACVMPQYFLHQRGIDVNRDITNQYVGSMESALMNVFLKKSDLAGVWPVPWRKFQKAHPQEAAQLEVKWETESLVNTSIMVRSDVPAAVTARVRELLLGLQTDPTGSRILSHIETAKFSAANDATYQPVKDFVTRFEKEVRPVERP